ncbi:MAG: TolC family protein [Gemmatimonadales bacterium]|nr:TolC family protein [Gemmatimonadales bacterium]
MLLTLCGTARVVPAQVVQDTVLARLTNEALAANPSLSRAAAAMRAANARVPAAGALPDPTLTAGVMNLTLPRFAFRESDFTEVDIELGQELPWPGVLGARTDAARAQARARSAEASARRREVAVRVAELYHSLRYVATAQAVLARQQRLLTAGMEVSTARYAATSAPQVDPLQARVAVARLDAEAVDLAARDAMLRAALRAVRGVRDGMTSRSSCSTRAGSTRRSRSPTTPPASTAGARSARTLASPPARPSSRPPSAPPGPKR